MLLVSLLITLLGCSSSAPVCAAGVLTTADLPCTCASTVSSAPTDPRATCACVDGAFSCASPPMDDPASADLPTPFSAEQIRQAMPKGLVIQLETKAPAGLLSKDSWTVIASDPEGVKIQYTSIGADNRPIGGTEEKRDTWATLQDHARFPRADATRERATFASPLGQLDGWHYTVRSTGEDGAAEVREFWFADALPGAPVRMVVTRDGAPVVEMEQVARTRR